MDIRTFLSTVLTRTEGGPKKTYVCISLLPTTGQGKLWDKWFEYPRELPILEQFVADSAAENNVYFSPHLFDTPDAARSGILPSRTIAVDLDEADTAHLPLAPSLIVQTSPTRYQAYWILKEKQNLTPDMLEALSRNMTYAIPRSDRTGWALGRRMRLPSTLNHKYASGPFDITVTDIQPNRYEVATLEILPEASPQQIAHFDPEFVNNPPRSYPKGPQKLLEELRKGNKIAQTIASEYNRVTKKRGESLWKLETALFRAGVDRNGVFWLAKNSKNNLYDELRQGADRELAKEVLRAEAFIKTRSIEPKEVVMQARQVGGFHAVRKQQVFNIVLDLMKADGDFVRTSDKDVWYIRRDIGRPVAVERHNSMLDMVLNMYYGLNATEGDHMYVNQALVDYGASLPITLSASALSFYEPETPSIVVHTGKKEVVRVTRDAIVKGNDGSFGVVFPWPPTVDVFQPHLQAASGSELDAPWAEYLFGDGLDGVINLTREEALATMQVWFMFLLFRHVSISRPILAFIGSPGSGKSTMFRRVYALLYGRSRSLSAVTSAEDYDHAVASDPLVVLDNVDTWERWLPDRLALSAATSDITKRRLYTNNEVVILKRQALVALTAHNPQFGRPDVADRLLIINLDRFKRFRPEGDIIDAIHSRRNALLGAILRDCQKVLNTRQPSDSSIPQFRIEDFARVGCWVADALGCRRAFESAINRIKASQRHFSLEDENVLVEALKTVLNRKSGDTGWQNPGWLWNELTTWAKDVPSLTKIYKNAPTLSKRMIALQEPLKEVFKLEWKMDSDAGTRLWRITNVGEPSPTQPLEVAAVAAA